MYEELSLRHPQLLKIQSVYSHLFSLIKEREKKRGGGHQTAKNTHSIYNPLFTRRLSQVVTSFTKNKQLTYLQSG